MKLCILIAVSNLLIQCVCGYAYINTRTNPVSGKQLNCIREHNIHRRNPLKHEQYLADQALQLAKTIALNGDRNGPDTRSSNVFIDYTDNHHENGDEATLCHMATFDWFRQVSGYNSLASEAEILSSKELYAEYTQMVWKSTTTVGCAQAQSKERTVVVCNYYPAGNRAYQFKNQVPTNSLENGLLSCKLPDLCQIKEIIYDKLQTPADQQTVKQRIESANCDGNGRNSDKLNYDPYDPFKSEPPTFDGGNSGNSGNGNSRGGSNSPGKGDSDNRSGKGDSGGGSNSPGSGGLDNKLGQGNPSVQPGNPGALFGTPMNPGNQFGNQPPTYGSGGQFGIPRTQPGNPLYSGPPSGFGFPPGHSSNGGYLYNDGYDPYSPFRQIPPTQDGTSPKNRNDRIDPSNPHSGLQPNNPYYPYQPPGGSFPYYPPQPYPSQPHPSQPYPSQPYPYYPPSGNYQNPRDHEGNPRIPPNGNYQNPRDNESNPRIPPNGNYQNPRDHEIDPEIPQDKTRQDDSQKGGSPGGKKQNKKPGRRQGRKPGGKGDNSTVPPNKDLFERKPEEDSKNKTPFKPETGSSTTTPKVILPPKKDPPSTGGKTDSKSPNNEAEEEDDFDFGFQDEEEDDEGTVKTTTTTTVKPSGDGVGEDTKDSDPPNKIEPVPQAGNDNVDKKLTELERKIDDLTRLVERNSNQQNGNQGGNQGKNNDGNQNGNRNNNRTNNRRRNTRRLRPLPF